PRWDRGGAAMEFRVLGPLEARNGGQVIPLGGAKQRALLAALLLHANEVVSRVRLIDGLWGEDPPATAAHTLETYVSRLRRVLHGAGSNNALITRAPGYMLRIEPEELDLNRFENLMREGRRTPSGSSGPCSGAGHWMTLRSSRSLRRNWAAWRRCAWPAWRTGSTQTWRHAGRRSLSASFRRW